MVSNSLKHDGTRDIAATIDLFIKRILTAWKDPAKAPKNTPVLLKVRNWTQVFGGKVDKDFKGHGHKSGTGKQILHFEIYRDR